MDFLQQDIPSVQVLLRAGEPFVPFSEYSVRDIIHLPQDEATGWVENKLREGRPFVIRGFTEMKEWDRSILNNVRFGALSSSAGTLVTTPKKDESIDVFPRPSNSSQELPHRARCQNAPSRFACTDRLCPYQRYPRIVCWITRIPRA